MTKMKAGSVQLPVSNAELAVLGRLTCVKPVVMTKKTKKTTEGCGECRRSF